MAYAVATGPAAVVQRIGGAPIFWVYSSADAAATVRVTGYFTDGYNRGMRDGDLCFVYATGSKIWSTCTVTVTGTTVDLADATIIGSTTNTD